MNCTQRIFRRSSMRLINISIIIYPISVQVSQHKNCRLPLSISINSLPLKSVVCKIQHSSQTKVLSNYVCFVDVHKTQLTKLAVKLNIFFLITADYFFCFESDVKKSFIFINSLYQNKSFLHNAICKCWTGIGKWIATFNILCNLN